MPRESSFRQQARRAISEGRLPTGRPGTVQDAAGRGATCGVCDLPVEAGEMEFAVDALVSDGTTARREMFHFHVRCFVAWDSVRAASPTGASPPEAGLRDDPPKPLLLRRLGLRAPPGVIAARTR